jgi:hypothetical protein
MCSIDSYDDDVSGDVVADVDLTHAGRRRPSRLPFVGTCSKGAWDEHGGSATTPW